MICVIPARGGSRRIPRKNIQLFHGKPIIAYSIELAKQADMYPVVSTEDEEIAEISRKYGARVFWRSPGLEVDEVGTQEVARDVLMEHRRPEEYTCVIYATSPLLTPNDIRQGEGFLYKSLGMKYAYSVDSNLVPTGGFYYGYTQAFIDEVPLEGNSVMVVTNDIDINNAFDWERAEKLYENN